MVLFFYILHVIVERSQQIKKYTLNGSVKSDDTLRNIQNPKKKCVIKIYCYTITRRTSTDPLTIVPSDISPLIRNKDIRWLLIDYIKLWHRKTGCKYKQDLFFRYYKLQNQMRV